MDKIYIDTDHPVVQQIAQQIKRMATTQAERVEGIFSHVRDSILFGFHPEVDQLSASEIIELGSGQCNNKSIVFTALCQALDIPVKLFFSDIDRSIHRGFIPNWVLPLFPKNISHSWVEVRVDGNWHRIDGYINDETLFLAGRARLLEVGWTRGFSVADPTQANIDFSLSAENFVQMAAVTASHGEYRDPADYFRSPLYQNQPKGLRRVFSKVVLSEMDRRVRKLREDYLKQAAVTDSRNSPGHIKTFSV